MDNKSTNSIELEDNTFEFIQINQAQVQQACKLINRSFLKFDPIYKKYLNNIQQVYEETKYYVEESVKQNLAFGFKLKPSNKIIGVGIAIDISSIKQVHEKAPKNLDQDMSKFQGIYKAQDQIQNILLNLKDFKQGEGVYGLYLSIDPQFVNYQLGPLFQAFGFRKMFDMGYKKIYGIVYNPVSLKIVTSFGGKIISKLKNQEQKLQFCLLEVQYTQDKILNKYIESNKQKTLKQMIKQSSSNNRSKNIPQSKL